MNSKEKEISERIESLEDTLTKAREYLETGEHAHWHGFRSLFVDKVKDGEVLPPHKDWVKSIFIPRHERALRKAQKRLDALVSKQRDREKHRKNSKIVEQTDAPYSQEAAPPEKRSS